MKRRNLSPALIGCIAVPLLVVFCVATSVIVIDRSCNSTLSQRLPYYPNAAVRYSEYNFITLYGAGVSYAELTTPDDVDTVRAWYGSTVGSYIRRAAQTGDALYGIATSSYDVQPAEDGAGSLIILSGRCAN